MGQTTFSGPVASQNGFTETPITTALRDAIPSPAAGLLIYNSTTNTYEVYNGATWQAAFGGGSAFVTPINYNVNAQYYNMAGPSQPGLFAIGNGSTVVLRVSQAPWSDQTAFANLIAMPSGTSGTVLPGGWFTMTFTTTTAWVQNGSFYDATVSGTDLNTYFLNANQALDNISVA